MLGRTVHVVPRANRPVALGGKLGFWGDSETDGRDTDETKSPVHVFTNILQRSLMPGNLVNPYSLLDTTTVYRNGASGRSLADSLAQYNLTSERLDRTFVFFQESGSQDWDGQRTPEDYGNTVDSVINAVLGNNPNATLLLSDSFNFDRGNPHTAGAGQGGYTNEAWRDWGGQNSGHNLALRQRVAARGKPNQIFVADVDYYIKAYQAIIGKGNVWFHVANEVNWAHFKAPGNLMVALAWFKALRYPIRSLCLDGIPTSKVSQEYRDVALSLVA